MKNKIIIVAIIIFLSLIITLNYNNGYSISIINNTNKTLKELKLKYKSGEDIVNIVEIREKENWKGKVNTDKVQGENQIILVYKDNKGNLCEDIIVGYLEKGYSGKIKVVIKNINKDGKLQLKI